MSEVRPSDRTFFGPGSHIDGEVHIEGDARLQGEIQGRIVGTGVLTVGDRADIRADIVAPSVVVQGSVRGDIQGQTRLELHPTAKVVGGLRSPKLRIDEGALFEGECRMSPQSAPRAEPASRAEPTPQQAPRPTASAPQQPAPRPQEAPRRPEADGVERTLVTETPRAPGMKPASPPMPKKG